MQRYYLLNSTVKKGGEMPKKVLNFDGITSFEIYKQDYNNWLNSLQPCEIDESELKKIKEYIAYFEIQQPPIEITDIVEASPNCSDGCCFKLVFKQPTEKQVESEFIETYDKAWIIDFVVWYSGMNKNSVNKAFQRYIDEVVLNNK